MKTLRCSKCGKSYPDEIGSIYGIEDNEKWVCERDWSAILRQEEKEEKEGLKV